MEMRDYDYQEEEPRQKNRGDGPLFGLLSGLLSNPRNLAAFAFKSRFIKSGMCIVVFSFI